MGFGRYFGRLLFGATLRRALARLRDRFREGIPTRVLDEEIEDTRLIYALLAELGGEKLVGDAPEMVEGTYWTGEGARP